MTSTLSVPIAFIGGGNMARAIIGGLLREGASAAHIAVVEPVGRARATLQQQFGIQAEPSASTGLARASLVVWAVKPQNFHAAAQAAAVHTAGAVHLSMAAGIDSDSLVRWLGTEAVVRAIPNTPALIGQGITGLFARPQVGPEGRGLVEEVMGPTGQTLWVKREELLDAVTALSGSGPAYVFYFLEAMMAAGARMGLEAAAARRLALTTIQGASALAAQAGEPPAQLRANVTSKGGTTHAALMYMQEHEVARHFEDAILAAKQRARALAVEFGSKAV